MKKKLIAILICLTLVTATFLIVSGKKPQHAEKHDDDWDYSSNSPDMFAIPEGNIGILDVQGNITVNNQTIKEYHGFPRPDYDSGWRSISTGETLNLTHNLGTTELLVYIIGNDSTGDDPVDGINQKFHGGSAAPYYGIYWRDLDNTTIKVNRGVHDLYWDEVRVMIWKIEPEPQGSLNHFDS